MLDPPPPVDAELLEIAFPPPPEEAVDEVVEAARVYVCSWSPPHAAAHASAATTRERALLRFPA
jgi:hypothetical protein